MTNIKIITHYFPQFHSIIENDEWWGAGFTDWDNVKNAKQNYSEHYQPRVPLNKNYYDLTELNTLTWQIDLAKEYGIDGFAFYHYWFDGKLLLERPLELFLKNKQLNLPFCLSWANETWSKRWIGRDNVILQEQKHIPSKEIWKEHFDYLKRFMNDDRYIKVDNRPILLIYQPEIINDFKEMKAYWKQLSDENAMEEIFFVATKSHEFKNEKFIEENYDMILKFQPRESHNSKGFKSKSIFNHNFFQRLRFLPEKYLNILTSIRYKVSKYEKISYEKIWENILNNASKDSKKIIQGGFVDWDNTPRYGQKSKIFEESTPEKFGNYLRKLIEIEQEKNSEFIFINAWNEWSESAYLEPDEKYEYRYLEELRNAKKNN